MSEPKLYIKMGTDPEFEISDVIDGLTFFGDDDTPQPLISYQQNAGIDGQIPGTVTYDKTIINANFNVVFGTWADYKAVKHDIYKIFNQRQFLRIRTDTEPNKVKFVKPAPFDIKPISDGANDAAFTIPFENPSGYKYSLVRSDSIYTYDSGFWELGMNLPNDKEPNYHFTTTNFQVFNASDIAIDPYMQRHDLRITIKFSGSGLKIQNKTDGSSWSYNKAASKTDQIILDGINTTLNGNPASANTDYGNITLQPGWNDISVTGATDIDIIFSFPFIYLG